MIEGKGMRCYFAAPLDSEECRSFNDDCTKDLRRIGLHVYVPHEHGVGDVSLAQLKPEEREAAREGVFKELYLGDLFGLQTADFVVAISTKPDAHLSAGLLWELGYATAANKPVYLCTRGHDKEYSLMVMNSVSKSFQNWSDLVSYLEKLNGGLLW